MRVLATVVAVHAFPVKSAAGPALEAVDVDPDGVRHDRAYVLVDPSGAVLTGDDLPALRDLVVPVDDDGRLGLDDAALRARLGRDVRAVAVPAGRRLEAPVHLVSRQAVDAALRGEHDAADCACSLERPRANLELDLRDPGAGWESGWTGRVVDVGEARLRLHRRPGHCLGVYAEVLRPGRVHVGDAVREVSVATDGAVPDVPPDTHETGSGTV